MQVSSKHLSLASVVFQKMLQGNFRESTTLKSTGRVDIPLPSDDPEALTILLNICHLRMSKVPLTVLLPTLAQLACLVDKYGFHEAVVPFSIGWIDGAKPPGNFPWTTLAFTQYMAIYYCFNRPLEFSGVTANATRSLKDKLVVTDLPIPSSYIGKLNPTTLLKGSFIT